MSLVIIPIGLLMLRKIYNHQKDNLKDNQRRRNSHPQKKSHQKMNVLAKDLLKKRRKHNPSSKEKNQGGRDRLNII